jgi:putative endonuclease
MNQLGVAHEAQALSYLQQQGLRLLARNFRCRCGEIDLIMQHGDTVVFIEVRARRSAAFGGAAASITASKLRKIQLTAQYWLMQQRTTPPCRIDAVVFEGDKPPQWLHNIC